MRQKDISRNMIFLILTSSVFLMMGFCGKNEVTRKDYMELPKIFDFVDMKYCSDNYVFCKLDVTLQPKDPQNPPSIWKTIQQMNLDKRYYRRNQIYRGVCSRRNNSINEHYEYIKDDLIGKVERSYCFEKRKFVEKLDEVDIIFGFAASCYMIFIIYCTLKTYRVKDSEETNLRVEKISKYVQIFSIMNTWRSINGTIKGGFTEKFPFIQGIRTVSMIIIILLHNIVSIAVMFSQNPEYVENFNFHPILRIMTGLFGNIVQVFFVISAWLLSIQLHNIVQNNGIIKARDVFVILLNRYFRLIPSMIIMLLIHRSAAVTSLAQPPNQSLAHMELARCESGLWKHFCFIQNWSIFEGNYCSPITWYLAVDTQLYILVTISFYISQKFKIPLKYIIGTEVIVAMSFQGYTVLTTEFGGLLRIFPSELPGETIFSKPEFVVSYSSTFSNLPTYVIGFTFGRFYLMNKSNVIFNTPVEKLFWYVTFLGFPLLASFLNNCISSRNIEVLLAISSRPIFSLGIAIGILGMATKTGEPIKKHLERKPLIFLSNFTYCTYLINFFVVFGRTSGVTKMVYLCHFFYLKNLAFDIISSFSIGALMHIFLEHPCLQLQKNVLPQLKKEIQTSKYKGT